MATRNIVPRANGEGGIGTSAKHWGNGYFDNLSLAGEDVAGTLSNMDLALAESTGYGIVSGCEPTISGLTVTVGAGVVHLADGTRKELSASNITLDSADSTNPRIDLVYITSAGEVAKVTGTAAASPSAPVLPTGGISVCVVSVADNASVGEITNTRSFIKKIYRASDYGINPNDDDIRVTLNDLITLVNEQGGGDIIFESGTYYIRPTDVNSRYVYLRSNVYLRGTGETVIKIPDGYTTTFLTMLCDYGSDSILVKNFGISGITFDLNTYNATVVPQNFRSVLRLTYASNFTFEDNTVRANSVNALHMRYGTTTASKIEKRENGIYDLNQIYLRRNKFIFTTIDSAYYDNTFIAIQAKDCVIEDNIFEVEKNVETVGGANTALEVSGLNISVRHNNFTKLLLAMDVVGYDAYKNVDRNINIHDNFFNGVGRGVGLWGGTTATNILSGVNIYSNTFVLAPELEEGRDEHSVRTAVYFAWHVNDSIGNIRNINIYNNTISMTEDGKTYIATIDKTAQPNPNVTGSTFDQFYNGMFVAGGATISNISIINNSFIDLPTTAIYAGTTNIMTGCRIENNLFKNCGNLGEQPILKITSCNYCFDILNNTLLDTESNGDVSDRVFMYLGPEYFRPTYTRFFDFVVEGNKQHFRNFTMVGENRYTDYIESSQVGNVAIDYHEATTDPTYNSPQRTGLYWINKSTNNVWMSKYGSWIKLT